MAADADRNRRHWIRTRSLAALVLAVWAVAAFAILLFLPELDRTELLGFPLGYLMLSQGAPLVFLLLVLIFNWRQDAIDGSGGGPG